MDGAVNGSAGWFDDPRGGGLRYFDGRGWTARTRPVPPDPPPGSLSAGMLSRRRRAAVALAAVTSIVSVLLLVVGDDVFGSLGLPGTLLTVAATVLFALVVLLVVLRRRGRAVRAVLGDGRLGPDVLWASGAQTPAAHPVLGVLAVTATEVRFEPRSGAAGASWAVPLEAVTGVETWFGVTDRLGGGYVFVGVAGGGVREFVADGRGLADASRRARIPFTGRER